MSSTVIAIIVVAAILCAIFLPAAIKILREYERGVIFRLGRLTGTKGPGIFVIIPFVDRMVKVDLRVITMDVPYQEVITRDNVTVRVNAVVYFRVIDPESSVIKVLDFIRATSQISQTTLRSVLGQSELDDLLSQREKLNQILQKTIDEQTDPWGIKVTTVEIKEVELAETMKRSMAAQAEAERDRRAKIIHAEGELQASEKLAQAGAIIGREPTTLQLRYLETLTGIAAEKNSTIIFPIPLEFFKAFQGLAKTLGSGDEETK
ncbi:MAG: slipin family protein [Dehalococcoidales bacterium]|nr:slipin family protein [Dehalococcoidales bacterium]